MKTIDKILGNTSALRNILDTAKELQHLNRVFVYCLDPKLARQCRIAKIDTTTQTLHVVVNTPAWATKLRYTIPDILKNLRTQPEFKNIKHLIYSVNAQATTIATNSTAKITPISPEIKVMWDKFYRNFKQASEISKK